MNSFSLKENRLFKEKYYHKTLKNGFRIIVIPKSTPLKVAFLACDFGGADCEYELNGEKFTLPYGTAHFLEHKMFEGENGNDTFLEFDRYGGNANAFTSYESTCYYFSCTDNFFENLEVLLSSVSALHCSEKSVEKEQKIIAREITMYEDLPNSNVTRNLCRALYFEHPTRHPISGSIQDISGITKDILYRAYRHFYVPENMALCICGDVDADKVAEYTEKYFGFSSHSRPKTLFAEEPIRVNKPEICENGIIGTPLYTVGIKCPPPEHNSIDSQRKSTAMRLAISLTFGRASDFYCENYENGLINDRFYAGYTCSRHAAHIVISGSGDEYDRVVEKAVAEINYRKKHFFTTEQILREKKAAYAESITLFDQAEDLTAAFATTAFLDYDEFDCIEILRGITESEIKEALLSIDTGNIAISIIKNTKG